MAYHTNNKKVCTRIRFFYHLQKSLVKNIVNKGITAAERFNKSKYGKALKKED